jgi:hypothetical protein
MDDVGIFYVQLVNFSGHLVLCMYAIWYTYMCSSGIFPPVLVCCIKKNLATLFWLRESAQGTSCNTKVIS